MPLARPVTNTTLPSTLRLSSIVRQASAGWAADGARQSEGPAGREERVGGSIVTDIFLGAQRPFGLGFWPLAEDDPGVAVATRAGADRHRGRRARARAVVDAARGRAWRTAVILTHPRGDFSVHYACPLLAAAGFAVLGFSTRYLNNDTDCLHDLARPGCRGGRGVGAVARRGSGRAVRQQRWRIADGARAGRARLRRRLVGDDSRSSRTSGRRTRGIRARVRGETNGGVSDQLGHIFKLGTFYSARFGATYLDEDGQEKPLVMGSYGIGPARTMAAIIEQHHDDKGIQWPASVAPYDVHVVVIPGLEEHAQSLADALSADGLDVLLDDRDARAGEKFADADLIGCPVRVTVGRKVAEDGTVDVRERAKGDDKAVSVGELVSTVREMLG